MPRYAVAILVGSIWILAGCKPGRVEFIQRQGDGGSAEEKAEIVRREGQPDMFRGEHDAEMKQAITQARQTYLDFVRALENPSPTMSDFAVKKPFPVGDGGHEHIWLTDVTFDGTTFRGSVNNEPVDITTVKLGDAAAVRADEISDWMYLDDGVLKGGYSVRVLAKSYSPEELKQFQEQAGFRFE